MIHEAILINELAIFNSKSEFRGYKLTRLTVEISVWETKKQLENDEIKGNNLNKQLAIIKGNIIVNRANSAADSNDTNDFTSSRKRKGTMRGAIADKRARNSASELRHVSLSDLKLLHLFQLTGGALMLHRRVSL